MTTTSTRQDVDPGTRKHPVEARRQQISDLLGKQPPHAIEAEAAVLGSMLLDPRMIGEVVQIITGPEDFYSDRHAAIYQACVGLYDAGDDFDIVHLNQSLRDAGLLEQVGGVDYLIELSQSVPSPTSAPYYASLVRDKALVRRLVDAGGQILHDAFNKSGSVDELLDAAEQAIFQIADKKIGAEASDLGGLLQELYSRLEAMEGQGLTGLETGYFELDDITSGLQNGEMIIIAARPSMGKTALALNIAEHVGVVTGQPVAVFSLEMSRHQLAQRLLCSRGRVDSHKLRRNMLGPDEYARLAAEVGKLKDAPIHIDDSPGLTLLQLRAKARRLVARHDIKLVVVDYLQLMSFPGAESRQVEVSQLSKGIKALARELGVPVICLSQLNRGPEAREGHKPRMSDLRESGSIEQDADVVMMLHREEYYHNEPEWADENPDLVGLAELIIVKQRNGPTGTVKMQFDGTTTRFNNHTPAHNAPMQAVQT